VTTLRPEAVAFSRLADLESWEVVSEKRRVGPVDVVIVGRGIAGGALATVLAAGGMQVLSLELQAGYRDHVRGEILWPWGVRVARRLGLERILVDAGAAVVPRLDFYDEGAPEPIRIDVDKIVSGVHGSLNIAHPPACSALAEAAGTAGADVRWGVRNVRIEAGEHPQVRWTTSDGDDEEASCGLVVGADGRRSSVRSQAGIGLEIDPPAHFIAGMLVEAVESLNEEVNVMARESDLIFYSLPQRGGRARLYLCFPADQQSRFAGRDGPERFLHASRLGCLEGVADWWASRPAGPCGTFPGEDSRTESPIGHGVVLIGDAAGYENPLQGQGLSMALQDVCDVSEALLSAASAKADLTGYAERRLTRKRLADLGTILEVWTNEGCVIQAPEERSARTEFIEADEVLSALELCFLAGFDSLPQDLTQTDLTDRLAAYG
jgi:2-polyprenyl-6-methoxyphenol hydroxylase-like FAD-dependent oxidoreductase